MATIATAHANGAFSPATRDTVQPSCPPTSATMLPLVPLHTPAERERLAHDLIEEGHPLAEVARMLGVTNAEVIELNIDHLARKHGWTRGLRENLPAIESRERPYWLTAPCPSWCKLTDSHRADDMPEDRAHFTSVDDPIELTLMPTVRHDRTGHPATPAVVLVDLHQHVEQAAPRVHLVTDGGRTLEMTIEEARQLAGQLAALVRIADLATGQTDR